MSRLSEAEQKIKLLENEKVSQSNNISKLFHNYDNATNYSQRIYSKINKTLYELYKQCCRNDTKINNLNKKIENLNTIIKDMDHVDDNSVIINNLDNMKKSHSENDIINSTKNIIVDDNYENKMYSVSPSVSPISEIDSNISNA